MTVEILVHEEDLVCPQCGATELMPESKGKPADEWRFQIRGFKVHWDGAWWSHCTCCGTWFTLDGRMIDE